MTIASSNFTTLAWYLESTYGVKPTSGAMRYTPFTGESLQFTKESISSNNINPSRQVSDTIQTGFEVGGGLNIELGPKAFDQFVAGAMWNNWGTETDVDVTVTAADGGAGDDTFTASTGTPFVNIVAGQFFQVSGMTNDANNGIFQAKVATDTVLTVDKDNYTLTAEVGSSAHVNACLIKNPADASSSVKKSYYIEKAMEDLDTPQYISYSGCMVNSMSISAQASSILTGSFDFMGKTSTIGTTTGSVTAKTNAYGGNILNSVSHVGDIRIGLAGASGANINVASGSGVYFQSLDFTLSNNLRGIQAIGQSGNIDVSPGQLTVTGNMNTFFQDDTMYSRFVDGSEFSLSYQVLDTDGEGYVFYFPRVAVSASTMSAGGSDQDLIENMTWSALMDPTTSTSLQINRFYADYDDAPA